MQEDIESEDYIELDDTLQLKRINYDELFEDTMKLDLGEINDG